MLEAINNLIDAGIAFVELPVNPTDLDVAIEECPCQECAA